MTETLRDESIVAPHGRDENGVPKAPYGLLRDGKTPRKGNRGARPGQQSGKRRPPGRPRSGGGVRIGNKTDQQRKDALCELGDLVLVTPALALSASPPIVARIGERQAMALSGDAVLIQHSLPGIADGLIVLSQTKPRLLTWLDSVEQKAPYLMLAVVGMNLAKAMVENHLAPNPNLARAGHVMLRMKVEAMARAIEDEARAMGIDPDATGEAAEPTVPLDTENPAA